MNRTGRLDGRWPADWLLALILVLAGEGLARWAFDRHDGARSSLADLVAWQLERLRSEQPDVWLVGNSTLAFGVDEAIFRDRSGRPAVKLNHGSASVRGSSAMLGYYLDRVEVRPKRVILLVTKDDLNPNGHRERVSRAYREMAEFGAGAATVPLRLVTARVAIRNRLSDAVRRVAERLRRVALGLSSETAAPRPTVAGRQFRDAPIPPDDPWFLALARDFRIDDGAIEAFAASCRKRGVDDLAVVLLPLTKAAVDWHDARFPAWSNQRVRETLRAECDSRGIAFLDLGEPTPTADEFRDYVHLNEKGRSRVSSRLGAWDSARR